jgi:uncharacterized protein
MKFWDSSAILPLIVEEERSARCRALRRADRSLAVWALTRVEVTSALHRLARERLLSADELRRALARSRLIAATWTQVDAFEPVCELAERLLAVHVLAAADSLQLAAALILCRNQPRGRGFITADDRLAQAAEAEGFTVVVPRG